MGEVLPPQTHIQHVHLRVKDLNGSSRFYSQVLGFQSVKKDKSRVALSAGSTGGQEDQPPVHIVLTEEPDARPRPRGTTGLFHVAIRFPGRPALATALLRLIRNGYSLHGASDHAVSEALYLADPELNGIELYCDRPREKWQWRNGEIHMVTEPLDIDTLLNQADSSQSAAVNPTADIGHVHLNVSSLSQAEEFYGNVLGFQVTTRSYPGALFLSAGGYHHHIGVNVWSSRSGSAPPENSAGLIDVGIAVPQTGWDALHRRLVGMKIPIEQLTSDSMRLRDYDNIGIELIRTAA